MQIDRRRRRWFVRFSLISSGVGTFPPPAVAFPPVLKSSYGISNGMTDLVSRLLLAELDPYSQRNVLLQEPPAGLKNLIDNGMANN
jgi:hypothetical protein